MSTRFHLPSFAALRAFEAYGRAGSMRRAGELLSIDQAIVSRHLRSLEEQLGVALICRPNGGLTEQGCDYHRELTAAFTAMENATRRVASGARNTVRIWSAPGFAYHWLAEQLRDFQVERPDIIIELKPSDIPADLMTGEADADIRFILRDGSTQLPRDVRQVELASPPDFPVANPTVAASIKSITDLIQAPLLFEDGDVHWRLWLAGQGLKIDRIPHVAQLWHAHLTVAAASAGQGVALTNSFIAARLLADGSLVRLGSPAFPASVIGTYMALVPQKRDNTSVSVLVEWLVQRAAAFQRSGITTGDSNEYDAVAADRVSSRAKVSGEPH
jgi:LysR family transcriptional regulator, glycine cleavage system transcriptional activator